MLSHRGQVSPRGRHGATILEFAVTASVLFFIILSLIVGGMGVFRYQEVAHLAREGARYAATHGGQYHRDGIDTLTGVAAVSSGTDVRTHLLPKTTLLSAERLSVTASWSSPSTLSPRTMPTYVDTDPSLVPPGQKTIRNYVTVTVSYQWFPEMYLVGPYTLSSTSVMPMSY